MHRFRSLNHSSLISRQSETNVHCKTKGGTSIDARFSIANIYILLTMDRDKEAKFVNLQLDQVELLNGMEVNDYS